MSEAELQSTIAAIERCDAKQMQEILQATSERGVGLSEETPDRSEFYRLRNAASFAFTAAQSLKA